VTAGRRGGPTGAVIVRLDRKDGRVGELVIVGEQWCAQAFGERDVHGVGEGHVVAPAPGIVEEWPDLSDPQRPRQQLIDRHGDLFSREDAFLVPATQDGAALDVEDLRYPRDDVSGQQTAQCAPPDGVGDQFDTGRGVDHDRDHASPAARTSARVSAAVRPGSEGWPAWRRSSQALKDSALTASSGLTMTTAESGAFEAERATPRFYELSCYARTPSTQILDDRVLNLRAARRSVTGRAPASAAASASLAP